MVIPSFDAFAPAPDLAGSYLGGIASAQHAQQIANESANAGAAIQMQQQRLQQESEQAAMANQIKQQQLQEEHLKNQQELAIKSQYEQQLNELKRDQLEQQGQLVKAKTQEAAQKYAAQQQFQAEAQLPGADLNELARKYGPMMGVTGAGMASLFRPQSLPIGSKVQGPDGINLVMTGTNQAQPYLPAGAQPEGNPDEEGEDAGVPDTSTGTSGAQLPAGMTPAMAQASIANRSVTQRATQAAANLAQRKVEADKREKLNLVQRLEAQQEKDYDGMDYYSDLVKGNKLTADQEKVARRYANRMDTLDRLNNELSGGQTRNSQSQTGELGAGEAIHTLKNGRKAVFRDKEFVRYAD